ncbi:conserved hypothetical protein [Ricinus communis]|uniref:Uncharacterized protein n=1 Tax=Ricinus communis TaxID=3988 RepID=B9SC97_RICCO|nr:conserved hypothetical protein [Ricinus communis]
MMQGQDENAFPRTFYLDYGSNGINLRREQNTVVPLPADALLHDGHPVMDWMGQSSLSVNSQAPVQFQELLVEDGLLYNRVPTSSMNTQSPVRFQDLLAEDGVLSIPVTGAVIDQSLVERPSEPVVAPSQPSANMGFGNGNFTNRPLSLQQDSSSAFPQNIDLNAVCESPGIDAYVGTGTALHLNPFKPGIPDADQNPIVINSSNSDPLVISSGIAGYVVEENDNREGRSSDDRRLSCKRRTPEDGLRHFSLGESSRSSHLAVIQENDSRRSNPSAPINNHSHEQYSAQLGTGYVAGLGTTPAVHQPSSAVINGLGIGAEGSSDVRQILRVAGEFENSQRNIRMRRTVNHQDFTPADLALWTTRNSYSQLPGQPAVLFPLDCVPNTSSVTGIVPSTPAVQSGRAPNSFEVLQPFQWNAVTRSRNSLRSTTYALNGGEALLLDENPSHNASYDVLPLEIQRRNLERMLTNINFVPGTNYPGNIPSSSRTSSTPCTHPTLAPVWFPQGNMALQYVQRISDIGSSTESQGQRRYCPLHSGVSFAPRERELLARGGNARPTQMPSRSRLIARAERQPAAYPEVALRSLTAAQRRSRLVSEVRVLKLY